MGARVGSLVDVGIPDITPPSAQPGIKEEGRARIRPAPRDPMTPKMKDPARAGGANRASRCSVLRTACPSIIAPTGRGNGTPSCSAATRLLEEFGSALARPRFPTPSKCVQARAAKFRVRRVPLQSRAEVAVTKRIQTNGCASWWTKVPLKGTEKQRTLAALRSKEPLSALTFGMARDP